MRRVKTAVLISGNGSNLQALLDATKRADYPAEIALVISNKPDAYGLTRANEAGIPTLTIRHTDYPDREQFDAAMTEALEAANIELVCLAGFMRILSDSFVHHWQGRLINIHPSLLPAFKGMHTHQRALDAGETHHGATVHWVIPELDAGEIIAQQSLEIAPTDTAETLQQRVHALEHALYPEALKKVAADMQKNSGARRAFSLVELSIVLVILGLLVGGILAGQSLIRASELRAVSAEYQRYQTAIHSFKDKYFAIPGDMANATSFWGTASACPGNNTNTPAATITTCNGNGNGILETNAANANEWFRSWQHLSNAGLVEGSFMGVTNSITSSDQNAAFGYNIPASKLSGGGWGLTYVANNDVSSNAYFEGSYGNVAIFGSKLAGYLPSTNILTPQEAWNIDTKLDDGKPGQGSIVVPESRQNSCHDQSLSTTVALADLAQYKLDYTRIACPLIFRRLF